MRGGVKTTRMKEVYRSELVGAIKTWVHAKPGHEGPIPLAAGSISFV